MQKACFDTGADQPTAAGPSTLPSNWRLEDSSRGLGVTGSPRRLEALREWEHGRVSARGGVQTSRAIRWLTTPSRAAPRDLFEVVRVRDGVLSVVDLLLTLGDALIWVLAATCGRKRQYG